MKWTSRWGKMHGVLDLERLVLNTSMKEMGTALEIATSY